MMMMVMVMVAAAAAVELSWSWRLPACGASMRVSDEVISARPSTRHLSLVGPAPGPRAGQLGVVSTSANRRRQLTTKRSLDAAHGTVERTLTDDRPTRQTDRQTDGRISAMDNVAWSVMDSEWQTANKTRQRRVKPLHLSTSLSANWLLIAVHCCQLSASTWQPHHTVHTTQHSSSSHSTHHTAQ